MKFLNSLMSTIFGLLLLSAMVLLSFEAGKFGTLHLIGVMLLLALLNLIAFRLLERIYRKVHPLVYNSLSAEKGSGPGFTILQAVISSLRSSFLCLAILTVSLSLLFVFLIPPLLATKYAESMSGKLLWFAAGEMLMIGLLGLAVQWGYHRSVLKFMLEKSMISSNERNKKKSKARPRAEKLQIRVIDVTKRIRLSKRGAEKQHSAIRLRRLALLRDIGGPLAALAGIIAVTCFFQPEPVPGDKTIIALFVVWGILFVMAWVGSSLRLADRTPLRQFRLGFGLLIHSLLVAFFAPFMLPAELPGRSGRPEKHWRIVPKLGQRVNSLLRSPRLFWIPAILFASILPLLGIPEPMENLNLTLYKVFACFAGGIISYEIIYRIFDRFLLSRKGQSNRLVFLRVFGDRRRGQFLFRHVVPRWKGLGSITCIAAPDVSVHQLEPAIGFDILFGRMRQRFLTREEANVIGRHINSDALGAVLEDHCFDDTWMSAVQSMLTQNAIVMMDLRGFGPQREGCIYELGVLRDNIPMKSVVFLIDNTTDFNFLNSTLNQLWKTIASDSPNTKEGGFGLKKHHWITIFRMSDSKRKSSQQLVKLLIEACVSTEEYHQSHGQTFLNELIDDLQLLAADVSVQIKAVGGTRSPGKKVLEAGYSCDHDMGSASYLSAWGLITDKQYEAIDEVNEAVQEIRCGDSKQTAAAMKNDPAWQELRVAAQNCLKALGKRRSLPKPLR